MTSPNQRLAILLAAGIALFTSILVFGTTPTSVSPFPWNSFVMPQILATAPTEPFACEAGREGATVYVNDTDDALMGSICTLREHSGRWIRLGGHWASIAHYWAAAALPLLLGTAMRSLLPLVLLAAPLVFGCAAPQLRTDPRPEPDCRVLGLSAYGIPDCDAFAFQVYRSYAALAKYAHIDAYDLTASIYAKHTDETYFVGYDGKPSRGRAYCDGDDLEAIVALPSHGDWSRTALAHELAHLVEGCKNTEPCDGEGDYEGHCWNAKGIWLAISRANHEDYLK